MPAKADLFTKHPGDIFIETGTHIGTGVDLAIEAGFQKIHSCELDVTYFRMCIDKFGTRSDTDIKKNIKNLLRPEFDEGVSPYLSVNLNHKGNPVHVDIQMKDSPKFLRTILDSEIDSSAKITFWLDCHWSGGQVFHDRPYPILEEIAEIAAWRKRHPEAPRPVILVDDMRGFTAEITGITQDQVRAAILEVDPEYTFSYEDGESQAQELLADILVAV